MTEGNGHVIDPNGDARRALQEAVAEHGPEVLSDAAVIDTICRDHLAGLPGESILIGDAVRTNVPALLGDLIPQLGNYGAIQSAATTLAGEHSLDMAASLWVVREFARALGYIAPATGTSAAYPGSGPRPVPGSGLATGAGSAERLAGAGAAGGSGAAGAGREESETAAPGGGEAGRAVAGGAAAGAAAAAAADEASRGKRAGSDTGASGPGTGTSGPGTGASGSGTGTGTGGQAGTGGETVPRGVAASRAADGGSRAGQVASDGSIAGGREPGYGPGPTSGGIGPASGAPGNTGTASGSRGNTGPATGAAGNTGAAPGGPGATGPIGVSSPAGTGPMGQVPGASGPAAAGARGGPSAPDGPASSGAGGGGWGGGTGGAAPEGEPGFPLPLPAGRLPGRQSQRSKLLNRNTVGIAAAIALIAGYLGVAAVAHLSPFPAKTAPSPSASQSSSPPASNSSSPASSPDPSADPTPTSQFNILLTKIPAAVKDPDRCLNAGTKFGATAISQCQKLQGVAASTIIYYLFSSPAALASGFNQFLEAINLHRSGACTTNGSFTDYVVNCRSEYTIKTPGAAGSIAEYTNSDHQPIIVSTDKGQNVMAVLIGINDGDLLAYWNTLNWVVAP